MKCTLCRTEATIKYPSPMCADHYKEWFDCDDCYTWSKKHKINEKTPCSSHKKIVSYPDFSKVTPYSKLKESEKYL